MAGLISKEKSKEYKWTIPILRQKMGLGRSGRIKVLLILSTGKIVQEKQILESQSRSLYGNVF